MAVKCPPEVLGALLRRSRSQAALEKGIIQTKKKLKIAKKMCGILEEPDLKQIRW